MQTQKLNNRIGLKGIHRVTLARVETEEAQAMHGEIKGMDATLRHLVAHDLKRTARYRSLARRFNERLRAFNGLFGYKSLVIENVTPTEGRTVLAKALSGNLAALSDVEVNYVGVGTGSAAPAIGDTQLGTETFRKEISSVTYTNNIFYGTGFYAAGEGTGTLQEHGLFINGSGTANSGDIISRLLLGGLVKGAGDTLTVETEIQINDA